MGAPTPRRTTRNGVRMRGGVGVALSGSGEARVCLHPGRLAVVTMSYEQLAAQFALDSVGGVYDSVGDVEVGEGYRPGFTLSLQGEFRDSSGKVYEHGVLFCPGVRTA